MTNRLSILAAYLCISLLILTTLILPKEGYGQNHRAVGVVPDMEKRSSIHEVNAYVQLSENMNINETRSEVPLGQVDMDQAGQGLRVYRGNLSQLASKTRGISVEGNKKAGSPGAQFHEAAWTVLTKN